MDDLEDKTLLHEAPTRRSQPLQRSWAILPWALTAILSIATTALLVKSVQQPTTKHSFETGWATDFVPARSAIALEQRLYTGGPAFRDDHEMFVPRPDPVKYIGTPGPEIDEAWDKLTDGRYIIITEAEARESFGSSYRHYYNEQVGGFEAGLDVFHTLHCLNNLRKLLHPDVYPPETHPHAIMHNEHCIEQLRQQVMCAADATPIPVEYYAPLNKSYVHSDVVHTCRNFDSLRKWMSGRFNEMDPGMRRLIREQ